MTTKRGLIKAMFGSPLKVLTVMVERKKAQIRASVQHPFHVIKNLFGYQKVSNRGMRKNGLRPYARFALAKRALLDEASQGIGSCCVRESPRAALNCILNQIRRSKSHPIFLHCGIRTPLALSDYWMTFCSALHHP